jgi:hypothetical protein
MKYYCLIFRKVGFTPVLQKWLLLPLLMNAILYQSWNQFLLNLMPCPCLHSSCTELVNAGLVTLVTWLLHTRAKGLACSHTHLTVKRFMIQQIHTSSPWSLLILVMTEWMNACIMGGSQLTGPCTAIFNSLYPTLQMKCRTLCIAASEQSFVSMRDWPRWLNLK